MIFALNNPKVQDKLEKLATKPATDDQPAPASDRRSRPKAEEIYELLCDDTLLPLDMTLAQIRQYVWKQPNELIIHYRKRGVVEAAV